MSDAVESALDSGAEDDAAGVDWAGSLDELAAGAEDDAAGGALDDAAGGVLLDAEPAGADPQAARDKTRPRVSVRASNFFTKTLLRLVVMGMISFLSANPVIAAIECVYFAILLGSLIFCVATLLQLPWDK